MASEATGVGHDKDALVSGRERGGIGSNGAEVSKAAGNLTHPICGVAVVVHSVDLGAHIDHKCIRGVLGGNLSQTRTTKLKDRPNERKEGKKEVKGR